MSVLLLIDYEWDVDWSAAEFPTEKDSAPLAEYPGIRWKIWLRDHGTRTRGGFYLFSDRAAAEAFRELAIENLKSWGGDSIVNLRARVLDIDEANSRITRGPLDVPYPESKTQLAD